MFTTDVVDPNATTDHELKLTDEQLESGKRIAADFVPEPADADQPAEGAAPTLVGRDKYMADAMAGKFMKQAEAAATGTPTDETAPPQFVGREAHMAAIAAGTFLRGAQ
jgi:hypothetical protein